MFLNKRIAKKIFGRCDYKHYRDYKKEILKPWEDYVKEQKEWKKSGRPITKKEMREYLDLGLYTEDEMRSRFTVVD